MTEEEFKHLQKRAFRYALISIIAMTNKIPDLTDDQIEVVLNNMFNTVLNSLKPDAAIIWNEEILDISSKMKENQNFEDIMRQIRDLKG
jgi:hypothetical protein